MTLFLVMITVLNKLYNLVSYLPSHAFVFLEAETTKPTLWFLYHSPVLTKSAREQTCLLKRRPEVIWTASSVAFGKGVGKKKAKLGYWIKTVSFPKQQKSVQSKKKTSQKVAASSRSKTRERRLYLELMRNDTNNAQRHFKLVKSRKQKSLLFNIFNKKGK